jgi:hypothetical protein
VEQVFTEKSWESSPATWKLPTSYKGRLDADVEILDLSVRARNVLAINSISRIGQLLNCSKEVLLSEINCGRKTLHEIEIKLFTYLESGGQSNSIVSEGEQLGTKALVDKLLSSLPERDQNVLADRYGLWDGIAETLQDIGDKHGVTRERIRQIESKSLNRLRRILGDSLRTYIRAKTDKNITATEGVQSEDDLFQAFSDDCSPDEAANALGLFCDLIRGSGRIIDLFAREFIEVEPGVYCGSAQTADRYKKSIALVQEILIDSGMPIYEHQLWDRILERSVGGIAPSRASIVRILEISPSLVSFQNGTIASSQWTASRSGRVASLCESVLEKLRKPAHFTEIAQHVQQFGRGIGDIAQATIHNVLVGRRDLFVWVKNGTYGLVSWGLKQPPPVKDRLIGILGESDYPMAYWFLREKTLEVCNCKESSVRMTLDLNPRVFKKFGSDQYGLVTKFVKRPSSVL